VAGRVPAPDRPRPHLPQEGTRGRCAPGGASGCQSLRRADGSAGRGLRGAAPVRAPGAPLPRL